MMNFQQSSNNSTMAQTTKSETPKSLKMLPLTKVKEMALMFNSKITQLMKREPTEGNYSNLKSYFYPTSNNSEDQPIPMPRNLFVAGKVPQPSPRSNLKCKTQLTSNCFVPEDVCEKLTVKDKAQLYNQYIKNVSKNLKEIEQKEEETKKKTPPIPAPRKKRSAVKETSRIPPTPAPRHGVSSTPSSSLAKPSLSEESESGLSSLPKSSSDELQLNNIERFLENSEIDFVWEKPLKPLRKKKLRKNSLRKKESSFKDCLQITSTDSESEKRHFENKTKNKFSNKSPTKETPVENNCGELDQTLMRSVNSPRKVKLSYTLCVNDLESTQSKLEETMQSKTSDTSVKNEKEFADTNESSTKKFTEALKPLVLRNFTDSFTDQGFETETKEMDAPQTTPRKLTLIKETENNFSPSNSFARTSFGFSTPIEDHLQKSFVCKNSAKQLFSPIEKPIKLPLIRREENVRSPSRRLSSSPCFKSSRTSFGFSTPIKDQLQKSFPCKSSAKQQLFSPIEKPMKNRRRSLYESESRRSSLVMIKEDQPLEHQSQRNSLDNEEQKFLTKADNDKLSKFWIKCGDFAITLDIFYTNSERVKLLYEIFTQTSCDTKDLHFGIDGYKFSVHNPSEMEHNSSQIPSTQGISHYWFSSGDLAIPFSGKFLSSHKIKRLFQFIKSSVEDSGVLRFGVDDVEFSNVPEFWTQQPKFSMESNYSMLVGLQSGHSNGLEERSKYAWPHSKAVKITDLDETSFKAQDDFEIIESGRLSYSPFGSNHYDLSALGSEELEMPRNSDVMRSLESYCYGYESVPLDNLFENNFNEKSITETPETPQPTISIPEVSSTLQQQLKSIQNDLCKIPKPSTISKAMLDNLQGTPEYVVQLKRIVADISSIITSNNLKQLSVHELECYMFFLGRYADICINKCHNHVFNVLNAVDDSRAVFV